MILWANAHQDVAVLEGWNIFLLGDGRPEIEYISEPADWDGCPDHPWTSDDEVVTHVALMAVFGSPTHQLALRIEFQSHRDAYIDREANNG